MTALLGGLSGGGSQPEQPALAVGPGEAAGLQEAMARDAGVGGVGFTAGANAGGSGFPQPTGSPTPNLQFDMSSAAGAAANQGNLTLDQLALLQGQQSTQQQGIAGQNAGFNTPTQNTSDPNVLGNPSGGNPIG